EKSEKDCESYKQGHARPPLPLKATLPKVFAQLLSRSRPHLLGHLHAVPGRNRAQFQLACSAEVQAYFCRTKEGDLADGPQEQELTIESRLQEYTPPGALRTGFASSCTSARLKLARGPSRKA